MRDWWDGPGCESANIGVTAKNPRYVYGGCYQGIIEELRQRDRPHARRSWPWPEMNLTEPTDKTRYRFNWTAPIVVSQHDAQRDLPRRQRALPHARSRQDVGADLARPHAQRQGDAGLGRHADHERRRGRRGVRHDRRRSPSRRTMRNTIYVGTDDGLVQLTRDGGTTWTNVTPPACRRRARERDRGLAARCRRPCTSRSAWIVAATTRRTRSGPPTTARRGRAS